VIERRWTRPSPSRRIRAGIALVTTALIATALVTTPSPASRARATGCRPEFDPRITAPAEAIPGYTDLKATTQQIKDYFALVDEESDRVVTGTFAVSWNATPLTYALVSDEGHMETLDRIVADLALLRDPRITSPEEAARISSRRPAIAWYTANVHGDEPSGADAAVEVLYGLAARTDCEAELLLDNLVTGIIPIQNPDGRDANDRENDYGFDLNRDWFARTQPETDGKLDLLNRYPPVVLVDAHEMSGGSFFFPPNADPVYHEITAESVHWIYDLYGASLASEFDDRGWSYFNYSVYDLFYMGYGDTVPTTGFTAAGMTFEKGSSDSYAQRWLEQWIAGWTTLRTAAEAKEDILGQYYAAHLAALDQASRGELEQNEVYEPGNDVESEVPDMPVRHYFLPPAGSGAFPDAARLVDRLLGMGVEVYRLTSELPVGDLQAYGRDPAPGVVRSGSYWIPMAQPQKHWIQAMLGEDTYVPFAYFYDVTAWSSPLLMNLQAAFSGLELVPDAVPILAAPAGKLTGNASSATYLWFRGDSGRGVAAAMALDRIGVDVRRMPVRVGEVPGGAFVVPNGPGVPGAVREVAETFVLKATSERGSVPGGVAFHQPKIAVFDPPGFTEESLRHLRYTLEQEWDMPYTPLSGAQVAGGALASGDYDVFVVPGISTGDLGSGRDAIEQWIQAGGTYVGTARPGGTGGTAFAISSGWTSSSQSSPPGLQVPGTLFRMSLHPAGPLTLGAPPFAYWFNLGEKALTPSVTGENAALYPASEPDFWFSGYAKGTETLRGSAGLVDETLGKGHVVLFSGEPNYRAYTEGTAFLLANALAYPFGGGGAHGVDVRSPAAAPAVEAAAAGVGPATGPARPIRIEVPVWQGSPALAVAAALTTSATLELAGPSAFLVVPNPADVGTDDHRRALRLLLGLRAAGIEVRSAIL
jgi:hypothetical protein